MTENRHQIGCIDGRVLTVKHEPGVVLLDIDGTEVRLSIEGATRLAGSLAVKPSPTVGSGSTTQPAGARETVADLLEAGLVTVGSRLVMTHSGEEHYATVVEGGVLDVDGHPEDTPSGAARRVTGGSHNGWTAWSVDGEPLAALRWKLRAGRFLGEDHGYTDSTVTEKRMVARRWVEYALARGLDPGHADEQAVEDSLSGNDFAESTLASYRGHLRQWFGQYAAEATNRL
ncbi:MAG: hypothetical protein F4Z17_07015 [Acidimicrobiia bacterium]|nr:hypothetical protein [Acidimicrobiia bacterium]